MMDLYEQSRLIGMNHPMVNSINEWLALRLYEKPLQSIPHMHFDEQEFRKYEQYADGYMTSPIGIFDDRPVEARSRWGRENIQDLMEELDRDFGLDEHYFFPYYTLWYDDGRIYARFGLLEKNDRRN